MEMQHFDDVYERYQRRGQFSPQRATFEKRIRTVYSVLEDVARERDTITYGDLAERANTDRRRYLSLLLGAISRMEHREGNPLLSVLVVQSNTGLPGDGFFELVGELGLECKYDEQTEREVFESIKIDVYDHWSMDS